MKALVTGGGGFLGQYIVEQLLAQGDQVRIFSRGDYPRLRGLGVETFHGDLRSFNEVRNACEDQDVVFHVAAMPGIGVWRKPFYEINVLGTINVIQACLDCGIEKLIYTSSPSVTDNGTPQKGIDETTPYPKKFLAYYPETKAIAEKYVLSANGSSWSDRGVSIRGGQGNLLTCALRPRLIWGPRDQSLIPRLLSRARAGKLMQVGDGTNLLSVTYVENAARGHLQACAALKAGSPVAGSAYYLAQPEPINCWEWINVVLKMAGLPQVTKKISFKSAWNLGLLLELFYKATFQKGEPLMSRFLATQLAQSYWFDISKAKRDFGYDPQISTEEGLRRLADYIRLKNF